MLAIPPTLAPTVSCVFPTVREVVALDPVRHGGPRVVTGETGLDRPVRWVHIAEVPTPWSRTTSRPWLWFIRRLSFPTGHPAVLGRRTPHVSPPGQSRRESTMRNLIRLAVAAAVTWVLVWLPTAAQAGITATGID
jgi:hypothetical protein